MTTKLRVAALLLATAVACVVAWRLGVHSSPPAAAGSPRMAATSGGPYALLLSSALTSSSTSLTVTDGSLAPNGSPPFTIQVESEQMLVTAVSGNAWTVSRGYGGTTAVAHNPWLQVAILSSNPNAPGTPSYNASWYGDAGASVAVYWDPVAGADSNTCTTQGAPCLTFGQIVQRYGSAQPILPYGQSLTIYQLSAQPAAQDPVFFEPRVSGGGQFLYTCQLGLTQVASGTLGTVTAKNRSTPQLLTVASMPVAVVQGTLIYNSTRTSYAAVQSMNGTTATLEQPHTASSSTSLAANPSPSPDDDWTTGDSFVADARPTVNAKRIRAVGGDYSDAGVPGAYAVQFCHFADSSTTGASTYPLGSGAGIADYALNLFDTAVTVSGEGGRGNQIYLVGNSFASTFSPQFNAPNVFVYGGSFAGGATINTGSMSIRDDTILAGTLTVGASAVATLGSGTTGVYGTGTFTTSGIVSQAGYVWGSVAETAAAGGHWIFSGAASSWPTFNLTSGTMSAPSGTTTGTAYQSGREIDGVTINNANLATYFRLGSETADAWFESSGSPSQATSGPASWANYLDASQANNGTQLAGLNALFKNTSEAGTWVLTWVFEATFASSNGLAMAVTGPASGATLVRAHFRGICGNTAVSDNASTTLGASVSLCTGAVTSGVFSVDATVTVGSTAGSIGLSFGQVADSATSVQILSGGLVRADRMNGGN